MTEENMTPPLPQEDASFLNESVQIRSYTQRISGKGKRVALILITVMLFAIMMHQLFLAGTDHVEVIASHDATIIEKGLELGVNPKQETISTRIISDAHGNGTFTLSIIVKSSRNNCTTGKCVYRMYASGPTRHGGYLHTHRHRLPESTENNATYSFQFPLYEPGMYKILVVLEALTNLTATASARLNSIAIGYDKEKGAYLLSERISTTDAHVNITINGAPEIHMDPSMYRDVLPRCRYTAKDFGMNQFEWVDRHVLEKYAFTPNDTLMIPEANLDPTRDLRHFETNRESNQKWVQPYQDYVWHSRTCVQKWVEPFEIRDLATEQGKLHIVLIGTSRVRQTSTILRFLLLDNKTDVGFDAITNVSFISTRIRTSEAASLPPVLTKSFDIENVCPESLQNDTNAPALAIMISHGIWEAADYNYDSTPKTSLFDFTENEETSIEFIKKRCQGRKFKIVIMTQPVLHVFRDGDDKVSKRYYEQTPSLDTPRIQTLNWNWIHVAEKHNLVIVDGGGTSSHRQDATRDGFHYLLVDKTRGRIQMKDHTVSDLVEVGNEVTTTFAQLTMAAFLQAFEE